MNARDKYDSIIKQIEERIETCQMDKAGDIAELIAQQVGCSRRDLGATFAFLTGQSIVPYIQQRQLMAAYHSILESKSYDFDEAVMYTGCSDQPTFNKSFKRCFQMTPVEAFHEKNRDLYLPAMTWAVISDAKTDIGSIKEVEMVSTKALFGIEKERMAKVAEAMDYQIMYGFTPAQSEAAFELAEKLGAEMKECFEFVDDYCIQHFTDDEGKVVNIDEKKLKSQILQQEPLARLCLGFDLSFSEGMELMIEFASVGLDASSLNPRIIQIYLDGDFNIRTFWKLYNWALNHEVDISEMDDFFAEVSFYNDPETALGMLGDVYKDDYDAGVHITPNSLGKKKLNPDFLTGYEWECGETDFSGYERFDEEVDEENLGYDDSDPDDVDYYGGE